MRFSVPSEEGRSRRARTDIRYIVLADWELSAVSGAQKLTSEFPTFACVNYVRLPVIVRLAQECRPTFV